MSYENKDYKRWTNGKRVDKNQLKIKKTKKYG